MVAAWARPKRQITPFSCGGSRGGRISSLWCAQSELCALNCGSACCLGGKGDTAQGCCLVLSVHSGFWTPSCRRRTQGRWGNTVILQGLFHPLPSSSTRSISVLSPWHSKKSNDAGGNGVGARRRASLRCFLVALVSPGKRSSSLSSALEECQHGPSLAVCCHTLSALWWCASRSLGLHG